MNIQEARLRAMLAPSMADWNLNDADRAAIRWALDVIGQLKQERDEIRRELARESYAAHGRIQAIRAAADRLVEALK